MKQLHIPKRVKKYWDILKLKDTLFHKAIHDKKLKRKDLQM
ncbi:hypothetical protein LCGC14_2367400, partial [marine sediment metagenome]